MTSTAFPRIIIENVYPELDGGRFPVKREAGERYDMWADVLMDGHDILKAAIRYKRAEETDWQEAPMEHVGNDRWHGAFTFGEPGRYFTTVAAWEDRYGSWARDTQKKIDAEQNVTLELQEGMILAKELLAAKPKEAKAFLDSLNKIPEADRQANLLSGETVALVQKLGMRSYFTAYPEALEVTVDRERARFSAWYEIFPRSQGKNATKSGTFQDCIARLPDIKALGFDVLYLTPIHPIGKKHRKGPNNSLNAKPGDPGSPYATADHKAIHPELGTLKDFRQFVEATKKHGMEIAMDIAVQCAPDHVYVKDHPEWFSVRPDGTIKYAENPPKKYQDIVNFDFHCEDAEALWEELRSIFLFWIEQGVRIFRVDNPHTKPFPFWEWTIRTIQEKHPDVIFLSEAFTRPKIMYLLAKVGFTQSYTYFTWRNTKAEFIEYLSELSTDWPKDYYRPNFFVNTPDILPDHLQHAPRQVFLVRAALAATLSANWGVYSGFELLENEPDATRKEYADSEKYEIKPRDWHAPGNIRDFLTALNRVRRENPSLQHLTNLRFHNAQNGEVLFYSKILEGNAVFIAVNLDPNRPQDAFIDMPLHLLGIVGHDVYTLDDLLLGHSWQWTGERQFLRLDPAVNPVAIFRVQLPKLQNTGRVKKEEK